MIEQRNAAVNETHGGPVVPPGPPRQYFQGRWHAHSTKSRPRCKERANPSPESAQGAQQPASLRKQDVNTPGKHGRNRGLRRKRRIFRRTFGRFYPDRPGLGGGDRSLARAFRTRPQGNPDAGLLGGSAEAGGLEMSMFRLITGYRPSPGDDGPFVDAFLAFVLNM